MESTKDKAFYGRNNLGNSSSPYLLQHTENPVWWQEWNAATISYAADSGKPVLVSVGYATCHWCHVMAAGAFSDKATADYLNKNFICIKIDREQRPDIDQYMMDFINSQTGRGGWPLNVFLTSELKPVFALTYAPVTAGNSMISFLEIAEKIYTFIIESGDKIPGFKPEIVIPENSSEDLIAETLLSYFDPAGGGFGTGQKFPAHSTILYLLHCLLVKDDPILRRVCVRTLDAMRLRGLNDHLQGGIYRYCTDREWTIPHFEKMLYDQAMALWTYALAYRVLDGESYKRMAARVLKCLHESFEVNGFYITAHDADTDHKEGATYLWSYDQLLAELGSQDFEKFADSYQISRQGNFEDSNHLIRINDNPLDRIEEKLLNIRKKRTQPSVDDKVLSGLNSLLAIALIQYGRLLDDPGTVQKAVFLVRRIIKFFWDGKVLGHSYRGGVMQRQGFLSDAGPLLTAVTMLYEDDPKWEHIMNDLASYVESFRDGETWLESSSADFQPVYATSFDHPVPSGISMALFGLSRYAILTGKETVALDYLQPYQSDFYNIVSMLSNGLFHVFTSPVPMPWNSLPANSLQLRSDREQDCYMGTCTLVTGDKIK